MDGKVPDTSPFLVTSHCARGMKIPVHVSCVTSLVSGEGAGFKDKEQTSHLSGILLFFLFVSIQHSSFMKLWLGISILQSPLEAPELTSAGLSSLLVLPSDSAHWHDFCTGEVFEQNHRKLYSNGSCFLVGHLL